MKAKTILAKKFIKAEPLFIKSFTLAKSNPNKTGLMVLFDILFLVSFFGLQTLSQYFAQSIAIPTTVSSVLIFLIFSLIYYLTILFAYSFFKYIILDYIKSLFEMSEIHRISEHTRKSIISDETEISFKKLGQFYSLNIIIAGIFFAIMFLANFLLASIKPEYMPFVFIFLAIPYLLFLYVIVNISHSSFYQGASIKEAVKKSFRIAFTKMKIYRETILIMILLALALWLLFLGSGYLIRFIASKNYNLYLNMYAYFKEISKWVATVVFYLVILINRISFYAIIRESK